MYVCMYVCMFVCIYICVCVYKCMYVYFRKRVLRKEGFAKRRYFAIDFQERRPMADFLEDRFCKKKDRFCKKKLKNYKKLKFFHLLDQKRKKINSDVFIFKYDAHMFL